VGTTTSSAAVVVVVTGTAGAKIVEEDKEVSGVSGDGHRTGDPNSIRRASSSTEDISTSLVVSEIFSHCSSAILQKYKKFNIAYKLGE